IVRSIIPVLRIYMEASLLNALILSSAGISLSMLLIQRLLLRKWPLILSREATFSWKFQIMLLCGGVSLVNIGLFYMSLDIFTGLLNVMCGMCLKGSKWLMFIVAKLRLLVVHCV